MLCVSVPGTLEEKVRELLGRRDILIESVVVLVGGSTFCLIWKCDQLFDEQAIYHDEDIYYMQYIMSMEYIIYYIL